MKKDPFKTEVIKLRVPISMGEVTVKEIKIRAPVVKDALAMDAYEDGTVSASLALLSSLTGLSEDLLAKMVPEDWADCRVILLQTHMRFIGQIDLFEQSDETENPTTAGTPPATLSETLDE
ncbi:MAG: hypothetical protein Ta2A_12440 [Treponemataceae bacterium]|nr:MAG: hypothetical protein Ta2A_12440 [Treponemataceae bacterium]